MLTSASVPGSGAARSGPRTVARPSRVENPTAEELRNTFDNVSGDVPCASARNSISASTPLPDGAGGRPKNESPINVIRPDALSIEPGLNSVVAVPDSDRKDPSVTEIALMIDGVNKRSNFQDFRSTAPVIEIEISKVSPTWTVAEPDGRAALEAGRAITRRHDKTSARHVIIRASASPPSVREEVIGLFK